MEVDTRAPVYSAASDKAGWEMHVQGEAHHVHKLPPQALEHAVQCDISTTFSHEVRELVRDGLVLRKEYKCARLSLGFVTALCVSQPPWPFLAFEVLPMADLWCVQQPVFGCPVHVRARAHTGFEAPHIGSSQPIRNRPARNFSSSRVASLLKKPKKMLPQAPPAGPFPPPTPTNANALVFILV